MAVAMAQLSFVYFSRRSQCFDKNLEYGRRVRKVFDLFSNELTSSLASLWFICSYPQVYVRLLETNVPV
jgi:hypothetical protein